MSLKKMTVNVDFEMDGDEWVYGHRCLAGNDKTAIELAKLAVMDDNKGKLIKFTNFEVLHNWEILD